MPKPANNPAPPQRSTRDVALKALVKAVLLPLLVVVVNTVREGWSPGMTALTMGIGVPLLWGALFVADHYIQPAVDRRNAQRRGNQQRNAQARGQAQGRTQGQARGQARGGNSSNRNARSKSSGNRKSKRR